MISQPRPISSSDNLLVQQALRGDLDAFNELVLLHQDMVYRHAYVLLGDPDAADDATQESFIKAFQGLSGFRGGSFRGWLLQIVTNSAYDILRKSKRHPTSPLFPMDENGEEVESPAWMADTQPAPHKVVEQNEFSEKLYRLINELPSRYRNVLTLVDLHEFDYSDAAEALHIPIGTVKSRLARARFQMKKKLEENNVDTFIRHRRMVSAFTPQFRCK